MDKELWDYYLLTKNYLFVFKIFKYKQILKTHNINTVIISNNVT